MHFVEEEWVFPMYDVNSEEGVVVAEKIKQNVQIIIIFSFDVFSTFLKLCKCYQIAQRITFVLYYSLYSSTTVN